MPMIGIQRAVAAIGPKRTYAQAKRKTIGVPTTSIPITAMLFDRRIEERGLRLAIATTVLTRMEFAANMVTKAPKAGSPFATVTSLSDSDRSGRNGRPPNFVKT